jgi:hypothetical protein
MPVNPATQLPRGVAPASRSRILRPFGGFLELSLLARWLLILGALFALFCIFFAEENWRGRRAWEICRHDLESRGVQLDWQKFIPQPVPDDQNFAMTPFLAPLFDFNPKPRLPEQKVWRDIEGHDRAMNFAPALLPTNEKGELPPALFEGRMTDLEGSLRLLRGQTNSSAVAPSNFPTRAEAAAALLPALEQFRPVLEELRVASRRPRCRFNIEYDTDDPFSILLPHYLVLQRVTTALQVRASAELALGKTTEAFDDVRLMQYLANSTQDEPFLITVLSAGSMLKRTEQVIWEGMAAGNWTEPQLQELQTAMKSFAPVKRLLRGFQAERAAFGETAFRFIRSHKNALRSWVGSDEAAGPLLYLLAGPSGWLYQEQVSYHRLYDQRVMAGFDAESGQVQPRLIDDNLRALKRDLQRSSFWYHTGFSKLFLRGSMKLIQRTAVAQDRLNQTITVCSLERYRLANGKYPDALDALVPRFIDQLPLDVCGSGPLKYRLLPNGRFLLYGIGWNQKDEAGTIVMKADASDADPAQGDWVWPAYPEK